MKSIPEAISEYIVYDPETGSFYWKQTISPTALIGALAGCVGTRGYVQIAFRKKLYYGHRIAWMLQTGLQPPRMLDHIDGDKTNNRWSNLRESDPRRNSNNRVEHRSGGISGVSWHARNRSWRAYAYEGKKQVFLGYYSTQIEAGDAVLTYKKGGVCGI